jgi:hypothetical protein
MGDRKVVITFLKQQSVGTVVLRRRIGGQEEINGASWMLREHEMRRMDDEYELEQCVTRCIEQFVLFNMCVPDIEKCMYTTSWYKAGSSQFTAEMTKKAAMAMAIQNVNTKVKQQCRKTNGQQTNRVWNPGRWQTTTE